MPGPFDESRRSYSPTAPSNFLESLPEALVEVEMLRQVPSKDRITAARMRARDVPVLHPGPACAGG
eukprot:4931502-Alexandrium_andersonii.AAC.1